MKHWSPGEWGYLSHRVTYARTDLHPTNIQTGIEKVVGVIKNQETASIPITKLREEMLPNKACLHPRQQQSVTGVQLTGPMLQMRDTVLPDMRHQQNLPGHVVTQTNN